MFNFLKNLFGTTKEEAKPVEAEAPAKVEAPIAVDGAGLVETIQTSAITTNWPFPGPFPLDPKPAEGEKKVKVSASKKPRAKKAKK